MPPYVDQPVQPDRRAAFGKAGREEPPDTVGCGSPTADEISGRWRPELFRWLADDGVKPCSAVDPLPELVKLNAIGRLLSGRRIMQRGRRRMPNGTRGGPMKPRREVTPQLQTAARRPGAASSPALLSMGAES